MNNSSRSKGGGIRISLHSIPRIRNSNIISNSTANSGGGISCDESDAQIIHCRIVDNFANGGHGLGGGGIGISRESECSVTNSFISSNYTDECGGGISIGNNSRSLISNCDIVDNAAYHSGGGIFCRSSHLNLDRSRITGNASYGMETYGGGGIAFLDSKGNLKCNQILENAANWIGGGIAISDSEVKLKRCCINDNTSASGGGIASSNNSITQLCYCVVHDNNAIRPDLHAIYDWSSLDSSDPRLLDYSDFEYVNRSGNGGGINGWGSTRIEVMNSTICCNNAGREGSGIYMMDNSNLIVLNSIFEGNTGSESIYIVDQSQVDINYSDFYNLLLPVYLPNHELQTGCTHHLHNLHSTVQSIL